ncbi:hypothetical protein [Pseudomonas benzenivorans]|uniref:Oligosaccharide repeat unit polymerase n=1 Tax=Pseudomonas benzenivorans TaxID=556533 RepID=A0ABY5H8Y0_9PSED|nr:hypothetical protein [Pseudomonas benzenivorans]UTW07491.1 hypothetical protein KDW96_20475 [Pseudomonas benzenivorans]
MKVSRIGVVIILQSILLPWLAVLLLRYFGPITHPSVDGFSFVFLALFLLPFVLLVPLVFWRNDESSLRKNKSNALNPLDEGWVFNFVLSLSVIYLFSVILDKIILSNVLETGVTEARYAAMADGPRGSLLGGVHYLLAGAPVVLACFLLSKARNEGKEALIFGLWLFVIMCFASFFLSGGRNSFVVGTFFILSYFVLERKRNIKIEGFSKGCKGVVRFPRWVKVLFVFGFVYGIYLFVERAEIRGLDLEGFVGALAENYNVDIEVPGWLGGAWLQIYYCLLFLVFYVSHSITYLSPYFESGYSPLTMGGYSFPIFIKIYDGFLGTNYVSEVLDQLILSGVYLTFPGSVYVDFGLCGGIVSGGLLAALSLVYVSKALWCGGRHLLIAAYLLTLLLLSPVFSVLNVGNGFSILMIILLIHLFKRS